VEVTGSSPVSSIHGPRRNMPLRRGLRRGKVTIRVHVLGADHDGRQEALTGGWSLA